MRSWASPMTAPGWFGESAISSPTRPSRDPSARGELGLAEIEIGLTDDRRLEGGLPPCERWFFLQSCFHVRRGRFLRLFRLRGEGGRSRVDDHDLAAGADAPVKIDDISIEHAHAA